MKSKGQPSNLQVFPPVTDLVPVNRLITRGIGAVGASLAYELIRRRWLNGKLHVWQRSFSERGSAPSESDWRRAEPETLTELEQSGLGLPHLVDEEPVYRSGGTYVSFFVHRNEPSKMFPNVGEPMTPEPHAGGRPRKYNHEAILIEAAAYIVANDLPPTLGELADKVSDCLGERQVPDPGHLKTILRPLFNRMKTVLGRR